MKITQEYQYHAFLIHVLYMFTYLQSMNIYTYPVMCG